MAAHSLPAGILSRRAFQQPLNALIHPFKTVKISIEKANTALERYVSSQVLPHLKNPFTQFTLAALMGTGSLAIEKLFPLPILQRFGILDENGMLDTTLAQKAVAAGFEAVPGLPVMGITFNRQDADAFFRFLEGA